MKILAVETATEACSAALLIDGTVSERYAVKPREHSQLILPMMQSLLDEAAMEPAQLDALSFGCGPGSFTGLRIAAGVVQGVALGTDLPVIPVSTLAALAQDCVDRNEVSHVFAAIDARMGEVYWSVYERGVDGFVRRAGAEEVIAVEHIDCSDSCVGTGIGSGWDTYDVGLRQQLGDRVLNVETGFFPRAAWVVRLAEQEYRNGNRVSAAQAVPVYLRNRVAEKKGE